MGNTITPTAMEALLTRAKAKLQITWPEDDGYVKGLIESAAADINYICGGDRYAFDYENAGLAQTLLMEYVFYAKNNGLHDFKELFKAEYLQLSVMAAIAAMAAAEGDMACTPLKTGLRGIMPRI